MSCAETPAGGKDVALEPEDEAVALALEKDEAELAEEVDGGEEDVEDAGDGDWAEEERKLRAENKQREEENRKKNSKMSMKDKVSLLDNLLQKAAAYTAFLRERMTVSIVSSVLTCCWPLRAPCVACVRTDVCVAHACICACAFTATTPFTQHAQNDG